MMRKGWQSDGRNGRRALECDLRTLYATERDGARASQGGLRDDLMAACVSACERELGRVRPASDVRISLRFFARAQLRFTPRVTWAGFACLALFATVGARLLDARSLPQLFSATGALLALICLANVTRSRGFGMAELESSCCFNAVAVVMARMLAMGVASAAILILATASLGAAGANALGCLAWMGAPYLVSCAGGLMCARRVASADARTAAVAWSAGVVAISAALYFAAPSAYASTALWIWAFACACAVAWLTCEVRLWLAASASGFAAGTRLHRA